MDTDDKVRAALQALLDWGREHTSPRDANSPHHLLVAAQAALAPPVPTSKLWNVIGSVFFANGFDLTVEADTEDEAREAAESLVRCGGYHLEAEIQEVCVQGSSLVQEE